MWINIKKKNNNNANTANILILIFVFEPIHAICTKMLEISFKVTPFQRRQATYKADKKINYTIITIIIISERKIFL